jgi:hypothetical protein
VRVVASVWCQCHGDVVGPDRPRNSYRMAGVRYATLLVGTSHTGTNTRERQCGLNQPSEGFVLPLGGVCIDFDPQQRIERMNPRVALVNGTGYFIFLFCPGGQSAPTTTGTSVQRQMPQLETNTEKDGTTGNNAKDRCHDSPGLDWHVGTVWANLQTHWH